MLYSKKNHGTSDINKRFEELTNKLMRESCHLSLGGKKTNKSFKFGGMPKIDKPTSWPICKNCNKHQTFIAELDMRELPFAVHFNSPVLHLFLCLDCVGTWWDECDSGPLGFQIIRSENIGTHLFEGYKKASLLPEKNIEVTPFVSLPSWGCLDFYSEEVSNLSCLAYPDKPWRLYDEQQEKISPSSSCYDQQVGGYPQFFEEVDAPICNECEQEMFLVLQIYSENADLLKYLGAGSLYYFACPTHNNSSKLYYLCE
ncbi:MAG: DUF1963 domain-containing protein [Gammaproteobacteria bacterium]|nr:DUF1963 domain-containing protein [Gammaproteobacteria bacterium]